MRQTILHLYSRSSARAARLPNPGITPSCHTLYPTPPRKRSKIRWRNELLLFLALLAVFTPTVTRHAKAARPLNTETFAPFTVIAREDVSPSAFVLTVEPAAAALDGDGGDGKAVRKTVGEIKRGWEAGLWAVEVKQPELMVAREYTPLPVVGGGGEEGGEMGKLRLYVRRMERGEVSNYLARLKVGDEVELRGPKLGFDLRARVGVEGRGDAEGADLGEKKKVVFLAGGTGISPALQAAKALLDNPRVEMEVVWANRRREDCVGCEGGEQRGAVVALLEDFRKKYGERFRYSCTVDGEGTFIDAGAIARVTRPTPSPSAPAPASAQGQSAWGLWPAGGKSQKSNAVSQPVATVNSDACSYHSPKELVVSDEHDPHAGTDSEPCKCKDADGNPIQGGKNLLMVSGPEGFVKHFAGAKVWGAGKEMQGPVKGVIGDLRKQNPSLGEDWLVLKM
ncbi:hypothetical protein B0I37DRAFT_385694 [Chaetomium sp. MPI-CAGE-AT-0009]|nr:hypothetical protein B0I37DRAFT_385694 [Chaetomium sp. MPI-CAGE-AT-0009]